MLGLLTASLLLGAKTRSSRGDLGVVRAGGGSADMGRLICSLLVATIGTRKRQQSKENDVVRTQDAYNSAQDAQVGNTNDQQEV